MDVSFTNSREKRRRAHINTKNQQTIANTKKGCKRPTRLASKVKVKTTRLETIDA